MQWRAGMLEGLTSSRANAHKVRAQQRCRHLPHHKRLAQRCCHRAAVHARPAWAGCGALLCPAPPRPAPTSLSTPTPPPTHLPFATTQGVLELLFLGPAMVVLAELVAPTASAASGSPASSGALKAKAKDAAPNRRPPLQPECKPFCELVQQ